MAENEPILLKREVEASVVPTGTKVTLYEGQEAYLTQSLGGSFTVVVHGNMFRIEGKDADALGLEAPKPKGLAAASAPAGPINREHLEKEIWETLRTCYDPEIPVNIVDLGLIYDCKLEAVADKKDSFRVDIKMTLTAPGCGMGPTLQADVQNKLLSLEGVDEANVELVWEPQWNQGMLTEAAKLQLGLL
jgi:probable FeS assembly SUF system protein SufT